jgi:23S rRNA (pseudouridine1915-N3)-methyltransferase
MKFVFLTAKTSQEEWAKKAVELYIKKIAAFHKTEEIVVHGVPKGRSLAIEKKRIDSELILKQIKPEDYVLLFDEKGKAYDSKEFAKNLQQALSSSKKRIIFVIGGAYGVTEELKQRAQKCLSLGSLTLNHTLAQVVAAEQVYRALTIIHNLPYHNE